MQFKRAPKTFSTMIKKMVAVFEKNETTGEEQQFFHEKKKIIKKY